MTGLIRIIVLVCAVFEITVEAQRCHVTGYYWREFKGVIPEDALKGGTDSAGKPIYIGQVYDSYLIPAKIYTNNSKAYYEYGGSEHTATENIKILCTQYPELFEWVKTNNDNIGLITDKELIIGGYEPGTTTYIGRVRSGSEVAVGKALVHRFSIFSGLHATKDGSGHRHTSFEVLTFNPKPISDLELRLFTLTP